MPMNITTSSTIMRKKVDEIRAAEGDKSVKKMIVVFELPFVVDEEDITRFFAKTIGQVRRVHIIRTGALIFSSALIEFQKKSHVQKAIALAMQGLSFSGEFEVILQSAEDFLEGKKPLNPGRTAPQGTPTHGDGDDGKKGANKCKVQ